MAAETTLRPVQQVVQGQKKMEGALPSCSQNMLVCS